MSGAPVSVTFFDDYTARQKHRRASQCEALAARIHSTTAPEKARPTWLKLARFGYARTEKGSLHHDRKVIVCSGVEANYDGEQISFDETIETIKKVEVEAIVYTVPLISPSWELMTWPSSENPPKRGHRPLASHPTQVFTQPHRSSRHDQ